MMSRATYLQNARALLRLGLPLVGSQVAQMAMGLTDTVFLGWYDVEALAGEVLGNTLFFILFLTGSGFGWAVAPMVSEAEARGDKTQARRATRMSLLLTTLFAALVMPVMIWAEPLLIAIGQDPGVAHLAGLYLKIAGWGMFPALAVVAFRSYLSALERTDIVFWVTMVAVALNVLLDWLLIFGNWGLPELGVKGAAMATLGVNLASALLIGWIIYRRFPQHTLFSRVWRADWDVFFRVFRLGLPIGLTTLSEVGLFSAAAIMMGWIGTVPLAAHGIVLQITAMSFMIHLGLSQAATVRAGQALGRDDPRAIRDGALTGLTLSAVTVALTIALFVLAPKTLIGAFLDPQATDSAAVIAYGVPLLMAAAAFQVVDAAQVMVLGVLRGMQDTRVPMIYAALSYWGIGLPIAYAMGFFAGWEGVGIWLGLAAGLASAALFLSARLWRMLAPRIAEQGAVG